jgi:hypothetical protein
VVLPALPAHQELAWSVLLELDERSEPWALVGGQMTLLHCLENGITGARPTDDGDVVLDVWSQREAVRTIGRWLQDTHGFELLETADGFGYRYTRGDTTLDLLVPEGLDRQQTQPPTTNRTRPALPIEGGNQALLRVERVPVRVGSRTGYVRRPTLLGAIVLKAAAFVADSRDTQRHAQDIGLLMEAAFISGSLRSMDAQASPAPGAPLLALTHRAGGSARSRYPAERIPLMAIPSRRRRARGTAASRDAIRDVPRRP